MDFLVIKRRKVYSHGLDFAHLMTRVARRIKKFMNRHLCFKKGQENLQGHLQRGHLCLREGQLRDWCFASKPPCFLIGASFVYLLRILRCDAPCTLGHLATIFCFFSHSAHSTTSQYHNSQSRSQLKLYTMISIKSNSRNSKCTTCYYFHMSDLSHVPRRPCVDGTTSRKYERVKRVWKT